MHSREVWRFAALLCTVSAAASVACWLAVGVCAALLCAAGCGVVTALSVGFTLWRYRQLAELSRYLTAVYTGSEPPALRDQRPGELSLLKDDIYKVTTILQEQHAKLEADKAFLSDFLSDVAHQLKTPLAAVLLQAELLGAAPAAQADVTSAAQAIRTQAERMQWLVEKLLKLSRLDAGVVRFAPRRCSAALLVRRAAGGLIPLLAQKEVELRVDCPTELYCRCDEGWTVEALSNLLKNAAEHTPPGGTVWVCCKANPLAFTFTVCNSGTPISQTELPHLFERFWKGRDAAPGSTGIGLSLAYAIAKGQNGDLCARNTANGPEFALSLYPDGLQ